jgi:hypothetical protein
LEIDEPADSDSDIASIEVEGEDGSSSLLEDIATGDSGDVEIEVGDADVSVDVGMDVDSAGDSVSVGE